MNPEYGTIWMWTEDPYDSIFSIQKIYFGLLSMLYANVTTDKKGSPACTVCRGDLLQHIDKIFNPDLMRYEVFFLCPHFPHSRN